MRGHQIPPPRAQHCPMRLPPSLFPKTRRFRRFLGSSEWGLPHVTQGKAGAAHFPRGVCLPPSGQERGQSEPRQQKKAIQQEWDRLRARKAWDEENPREWDEVAKEARQKRIEVHFGMIFGFVVEKTLTCPRETLEENSRAEWFSKEITLRTKTGRTQCLPICAVLRPRWRREDWLIVSGCAQATRYNNQTQRRLIYRPESEETYVGIVTQRPVACIMEYYAETSL